MGFTLAADPDRRDALKQELERILPLIVVRRTTQPFVQRSVEIMNKVQPRFALDVLVYTPEELAELQQSSSFVRGAMREGKVIYEM